MKEEMVRVNVLISREQRRQLFHVLLDEGISFSEWTRRNIDAYLAKKGKFPKPEKPERRKGK